MLHASVNQGARSIFYVPDMPKYAKAETLKVFASTKNTSLSSGIFRIQQDT